EIGRRRTSEDAKVLGGRRQNLAAGFRDHHRVFDPDSSETLQIYTRLDGDRHPRLKTTFVLFADPRRLVDLQTEAVAGGVHERAVQPVALQHTARGRVDVARQGADAHRLDARQLRFEHRA